MGEKSKTIRLIGFRLEVIVSDEEINKIFNSKSVRALYKDFKDKGYKDKLAIIFSENESSDNFEIDLETKVKLYILRKAISEYLLVESEGNLEKAICQAITCEDFLMEIEYEHMIFCMKNSRIDDKNLM